VQALADGASRRAGLDKATPKWADRAAIKEVFAEALQLTAKTGIPHEVDHIIPLKGKMVSGLHVQWNLRAITASDNRRKSNKDGLGTKWNTG
jgi:5-methylcytosine-specific restriction endonuclease McrA